MPATAPKKRTPPGKIWIISEDRHSDYDIGRIDGVKITGTVRRYRISALARYMLNPNPIEIRKKLVGYTLHNRRTLSHQLREKLGRLIPKRFRGSPPQKTDGDDFFISETETKHSPLQDKDLEHYLLKTQDSLRLYHPLLNRLSKIDPARLADVNGVCVGSDNNPSLLKIKGNITEKLQYLERLLLKDVNVILEKAYIAKGLFELEGYDFTRFDPSESYHLIKFTRNETTTAKVLRSEGKTEFLIDDIKLLEYILLLEQSLETNPNLMDSFRLCLEGKAIPLRLFFNSTPLIDYSEAPLPQIYQKIFKSHYLGTSAHKMVLDALNQLQSSIALNYIPHSDLEKERIVTDISVIHNFKALEAIKKLLPQIYTEIDKQTCVSEVGKFYLLDCVRGYRNG